MDIRDFLPPPPWKRLPWENPINIAIEDSHNEELKAIHDYHTRAHVARSKGDVKTAEMFEHIASEEGHHAQELADRARELGILIV